MTFVLLVGTDLDDETPAGKIVGWPLILLVAAAVAIAVSFTAARRTKSPGVNDPDRTP